MLLNGPITVMALGASKRLKSKRPREWNTFGSTIAIFTLSQCRIGTAIFNLESALLMFKNRVKSVNTLEDLSTEYNIYCSKTMSVPFNLTD